MLGGRDEARGAGEVRALRAADLGLGEARADHRILAGPLGDAAPAGIAGQVEHRREGEVEARGRGLVGGVGGGRLPQRGIEGAGLGERDGEDGAEAVDHVEGEEERHAEARLLDRRALRLAHGVAAPEVEDAAEPARAHVRGHVDRHGRAGHGVVGAEDGQLADLLLERHPPDEIGRLRRRRPRRERGRRRQRRGAGDQPERPAAGGRLSRRTGQRIAPAALSAS